ncbi:MAG: SDR family NAD(P)-dependent oxidoreductase [Clostridiales bacterium]|nr:SDR family NAD(P)-dependent oxidoreductase [Clostridiales bacterium]
MSFLDLFRLDGKAALVTGGSRGLGLEAARALRDAGAKVALLARRASFFEEARKHIPDALFLEGFPTADNRIDLFPFLG